MHAAVLTFFLLGVVDNGDFGNFLLEITVVQYDTIHVDENVIMTQNTTGTGTILPTDTTMFSELPLSRRSVDYAQQWLGTYTQFSVTYDQTQAQGTLTEAGLWDSDGNLWSHVKFATPVAHDATSNLTVQWIILHTQG